MNRQLQLIQFARWPRPGRVKTRLEPELGVNGALQAHIRLTLTVMARLQASGHPLQLVWDEPLVTPPAESRPILDALARHDIQTGLQQGANLGERMIHALSTALSHAGRAMIIGSDCPSVDASYIEQARVLLDQADVVFGPSDDGGYVLIGARRTAPDMLSGVAWGTSGALTQSICATERSGLSVALLPPRWDVDEPADWYRFIRFMAQSESGG